MTWEVSPVGLRCNLACSYCYEDRLDRSEQRADVEKILAALDAAKIPKERGFNVFGGEPLLAPLEVLEALFKYGLEKHGRNSIQTNTTLVNDQHVDLFLRYKVSVGVSVDGPDELNEARCGPEMTARTFAALDKMLAAKVSVSGVIVTLTRANASLARLPKLVQWLVSLEDRGITKVNLHLMQQGARGCLEWGLSDEGLIAALRALREVQITRRKLDVTLFREIGDALMGRDANVCCIWNACDVRNTSSVYEIGADGCVRNCSRTYRDGVVRLKTADRGFDRVLLLHETPMEDGGCKGCRFFLVCKGLCPSTAIDDDWRNRTTLCRPLSTIMADIEGDLMRVGLMPISRHSDLPKLEAQAIAAWRSGNNFKIQQQGRGRQSGPPRELCLEGGEKVGR